MTESHWSVSIHKDGNHVLLYKRNAKQRVAAVLSDIFFAVDEKLDHRLCGGNIPESWWNINIGKRDYDEEYEILDSSLGSRIYSLQSSFMMKIMDATEGDEVMKLPISQEQTDKLWPEMAFLGEDDDDE